MKKITTITLGLLLSLSTFANVRTVNNFVPNVAQFSNVQSAINASAVGDTLLIHGSPLDYGSITLNRRLCLIGAGSNLTNTINNYKTTLGIITVDSTNSNPNLIVSGFSIHGIEFVSFTFASIYANNVVVSRCSFTSSAPTTAITGNNWVIKNCFINSIILTANPGRVSSNIIIANNIINGSIVNGSSTIFAPNVIATNNIILNSSGGTSFNVLLTNNIFFNTVPNSIGGNVFNKNLTYTTSSTLLVNLPPTGNTGTGNINNTIPNFINVPNPTTILASKTPAFANYNFAFPTTAAGYNAGTDATNIGITGGPYPWNGNNLDGRAQIPLMQELNINNSVINQGQPLNVDFKARKNN
jgi:hypothetical protein